MTLSAVIVTYNNEKSIRACIESLEDNSVDEIVVVDNASSDSTLSILEEYGDRIKLRQLQKNSGFACGVNAGVFIAESEHLLIINPDAKLEKGSLEIMLERLGGSPEVGLVGPRIVDDQGRPEWSWGKMAGTRNEIERKLKMILLERRLWKVSLPRQNPDWISGACWLLETNLYKQLGGLDQHFFMYFEDIDFCSRLRMKGFAIEIAEKALLVHQRGESWDNAKLIKKHYRQSQKYFYKKHLNAMELILLRLFHPFS